MENTELENVEEQVNVKSMVTKKDNSSMLERGTIIRSESDQQRVRTAMAYPEVKQGVLDYIFGKSEVNPLAEVRKYAN